MPTIEEQMLNLPLSMDLATQEELNAVNLELSSEISSKAEQRFVEDNFVALSGEETLSGDLYKHRIISVDNPLYGQYVYKPNPGQAFCSPGGLAHYLSYILYGGSTAFDSLSLFEVLPAGDVPLTAQSKLSDVYIDYSYNRVSFYKNDWRGNAPNEYSTEYYWNFEQIGDFRINVLVTGEPNPGAEQISTLWGEQVLYRAWNDVYLQHQDIPATLDNGQTVQVYVNCHTYPSPEITATTFEAFYNAETNCYDDNKYLDEYEAIDRFALTSEIEEAALWFASKSDLQTLSTDFHTVVSAAPEAFDTLKEIADWIGNDETGVSAMVKEIANKADISALNYLPLSGGTISGSVKVTGTIFTDGSLSCTDGYLSVDAKQITIGNGAVAGDGNNNNNIAVGVNAKSGNQYGSYNIAIGSSGQVRGGSNSIAVGSGAFVGQENKASNNSIAIGSDASISWASDNTDIGSRNIALGHQARIHGNVSDAVQIGSGTNTTNGSLQFRSYTLVDSDGNVPYARISAALPEYTPLSVTQALSTEIVDGLSVDVNEKLSTIADLVSAEVERLDTISSEISSLDSEYVSKTALKNQLSSDLSAIDLSDGSKSLRDQLQAIVGVLSNLMLSL